MERIPFHRPFITDEEINGVVDSLRSGWVTTGPKVKQFEKEFAGYVGAKHAIAVNSCTAALHLALEAIGLEGGDEVITSPLTFAATAEVVRYFDAKPVFTDIESASMNMDVSHLQARISERKKAGARLKAIIPVHFAGQPCDMERIMEIARNHGLKVIEDAAHTLPGRYNGRDIGTIGDVTCFSFYATKPVTTGEGGMATTDNDGYAERMRIMSLHGMSKDAWKRYTSEGGWYYEIVSPGYKYNLTDIAASLGLAQLKKADSFHQRRERIASMYTDSFERLEQVETPMVTSGVTHSWHLYVLKLNLESLTIDRNRFIEELKGRGVETSVHFIPLHIHPYYRDTYGYAPGDFPVAFDTYKRVISLPIYPLLSDDEVGRVIQAVSDAASRFKR